MNIARNLDIQKNSAESYMVDHQMTEDVLQMQVKP